MNEEIKRHGAKIGLDVFLLAAYFMFSPMHQTLLLSSGGTVVKYLALLVMIACVLQGYLEYRRFIVIWDLVMPLGLMFGWFVLSIIWSDSRSASISLLISLGSYCLFMLLVGSRRLNEKEKALIMIAIIVSCTFYAVSLIRSAATTRRATLVLATEESEKEADQNAVALNIGFGALAAFSCFLQRKSGMIKWMALACMLVILAGIFSTGSRGGLLALLAGAGYLFFQVSRNNPRLRNAFFIIPAVFLLFFWILMEMNLLGNDSLVTRFQNIDVSSMSGRTEIWGQYLGTLIQRPVGFLCGYGVGCDTVAHAAYMMRNWYRASHNDLISVLCWGGIPGILLIGSFVHHVWRRGMEKNCLLGCACMILALVGSMDVNFFKTYGWWNAMLIAYIGIGQTADAEAPAALLSLQRHR